MLRDSLDQRLIKHSCCGVDGKLGEMSVHFDQGRPTANEEQIGNAIAGLQHRGQKRVDSRLIHARERS